jgi:glucokinase
MDDLAIGVDLGGTNLRVALVSAQGKILDQRKFPTPSTQGPERFVELIAEAARILSQDKKLKGLGMGSPGPLSRSARKISRTPHLPTLEDFPIGEALEKELGVPVYLGHDSKCAALGESVFGVAEGVQEFLLLTFGTGIGGAAVSRGRLIHGAQDGAGEMGHFTLYPEGRLCSCGNRGCFEEFVSARALERRASEDLGEPCTNPQLLERAKAGDLKALKVLEAFTTDLAIGTASLVNIFNPSLIVFAGGLFTTGGGPIIPMVEAKMRGRCFAVLQKNLQIKASALGGDAGVLGAAALALYPNKDA